MAKFTTALGTLTSLTPINFATRPLWGHYPTQSNKKHPPILLKCQLPGTNPNTARPRPHNTKLEPQPALEVSRVNTATAFGCRGMTRAALCWRKGPCNFPNAIQKEPTKGHPVRCRSEVTVYEQRQIKNSLYSLFRLFKNFCS